VINGEPQRLPTEALHQRFIQDLGQSVVNHGDPAEKPLLLDLGLPLPPKIRLYLFNCTHPPGGRSMGEHKIQVRLPGQIRGTRANFDDSDGRMVILAGYQQELDVYIFWDSGLYRDIPDSRNVQVAPETVYRAYGGQIAQQTRNLRCTGMGVVSEVIVAAHSRNLVRAIERRQALTLQRLTRRYLWQDSAS
jgi:hypothetical protein